MFVTKRDGSKEPRDINKIHKATEWACDGLDVSQSELEMEADLMFYDGMPTTKIHDSLTQAAASLISLERQDYTYVAARHVLQKLYKEAWNSIEYPTLRAYIEKGVAEGKLDPRLATDFDLEALDMHVVPARDLQFTYLGIQTLADRYFIREGEKGRVIELPQHFYMRVAMGLALNEADKTASVIEFYDVLSTHAFSNSTPTLFNAGTRHSQLASCFLNTVADTLVADSDAHPYASIMGTITECAILSKYAGGVGTDWHRVRELGSWIKGTDGTSSGPVPYLKIYNDVAVAVNQGGKRQGSFAPYIEPHHPDLYAYCDLKKESGDERLRAHDIYPALWVNDLFFERKEANGMWSFFSPKKYPELHELWGDAFKQRYEELEAAGAYTHQIPAKEVWKKMLSSLFETGHPWITFKDECNRRNPQQHVGVIHNSNLCTEITLNTSDDETAVCNIGSINLAKHIHQGKLDFDKLRRTARTAVRMLDNVIDINFYGSDRARNANTRHRPIGSGLMGYTEAMVACGIDWESQAHLEWADQLMEHFSFYTIEASSDLAAERGAYASFAGSLWSKGILPIDTAKAEAKALTMRSYELDWEALRRKVMRQGMRNSNTMAIAPTATISNIVGTTPTIEPSFELVEKKKNLSGPFKVVDPSFKYGRPELCKVAHDIDQLHLVTAAGVRGKWFDQAQSTNIFVKSTVKGKDLDAIYTRAWRIGCKTTYYLKTQSAKKAEQPAPVEVSKMEAEPVMCSLDNPNCESCQ